jgi:hypothetical protein
MVTSFAHFIPFANDPDCEVSSLLTEVSAWFSNDSIAFVFGGF